MKSKLAIGMALLMLASTAAGPASRPTMVEMEEAPDSPFGGPGISTSYAVGVMKLMVRFRLGEGARVADALPAWISRLRWRTDTESGDAYCAALTNYSSFGDEVWVTLQVNRSGTQDGNGVDMERVQRAFAEDLQKRVAEANSITPEVRAQADKKLRELSERSQAMRQGAAAPPQADETRRNALQQQELRTEMELVAKEARRDALQQAIDRLRSETKVTVESDPVAKEYRRIVELTETQVAKVQEQIKVGGTSQAELTAAQMKLAEARAQLAGREVALSKASKGETLDKLTDELTFNTVDLVSLQRQKARLGEEIGEAADLERARSAFTAEVAKLGTQLYRANRDKLLRSIEEVKISAK